MIKTSLTVAAIAAGLLVSACANEPYEPVLDGGKTAQYQSDLAECRQASLRVTSNRKTARNAAIAGAVIGAATADSGEALEGAIGTSIGAGLFGQQQEKNELQEDRDRAVFNCLRNRGHAVIS
ncbi:MAG: hypothetical protein ACSHXB_04180 [Sulfitobacter sp.]